jgi:hypothetical protein
MCHTPDDTPARLRLDRALEGVAVTFRGMTARSDDARCTCHWGSEEELALLKIPDVELEPDLLRRTWRPVGWKDHGAMLRRILPQFTRELVAGRLEPDILGMGEVGRSFARGHWQEWPAGQRAVVGEFLWAWWTYSLTEAEPAVPAHEVLAVCAEASGSLGPWLEAWEELEGEVADRHLAEAAAHWDYDLLGDELPWYTWEDGDARRTELAGWLVRYAPTRLSAEGGHEELLQRIRLIGLTGPARYEDPHWPGYRY